MLAYFSFSLNTDLGEELWSPKMINSIRWINICILSERKFLIRIKPERIRTIPIHFKICFRTISIQFRSTRKQIQSVYFVFSFRLDSRIESDWFLTDLHRTKFKMFFGFVQNSLKTNFGIARNHSDWIPYLNFR